jgi:hypothetical protein
MTMVALRFLVASRNSSVRASSRMAKDTIPVAVSQGFEFRITNVRRNDRVDNQGSEAIQFFLVGVDASTKCHVLSVHEEIPSQLN